MAKLSVARDAALAGTPSAFEQIRVRSTKHWRSLRAVDVTASNVGALFNGSDFPWFGRFGLWEIKTGRREDSGTASRAMRRGNAFEEVAFEELAEQFPDWSIYPTQNRHYFRDPANRIGATPDGFAVRPDRPGFGIIQVKTATFLSKSSWFDEDREPYCPTWIGLQAMTEATLTGASWATVVVIVVDSEEDLILVDVPLVGDLWNTITREANAFWKTVHEGLMPEADPSKDYGAVMRTFPRDNGEIVDLSHDQRLSEIAPNYIALRALEAAGREATEKRRAFDAEIVMKLGPARSAVIAGGGLIEAKTIRRMGGSYRKVSIHGIGANGPLSDQPSFI